MGFFRILYPHGVLNAKFERFCFGWGIIHKNSFVHMLYYANEINLVGLVQSSSFAHWAGSELAPTDDGKVEYAWPGVTWMDEMIDDYA